MGDNLKEKFLDGGHDNAEVDNFEALASSLGRITQAFQNKQQLSAKFHAGLVVNDTRAQWRRDLAEALESTFAHVFVVSLLLIDLLATVVDILKTIHNKTTDLNSCTSLLESCMCADDFDRLQPWEFIYWISIVILTVLAVNVVLEFVAFGPHFFKHPGYVLDAFVVFTALALEIFLDSETVGLLIILTLWRIVRVAHGIFEVTDEAWEKNIKMFEQRLGDAKSKHDSDQEILRAMDLRIAELEKGLGK